MYATCTIRNEENSAQARMFEEIFCRPLSKQQQQHLYQDQPVFERAPLREAWSGRMSDEAIQHLLVDRTRSHLRNDFNKSRDSVNNSIGTCSSNSRSGSTSVHIQTPVDARDDIAPSATTPSTVSPDDPLNAHTVQLLPHVHGTDGFFIARYRRVR